MKSPGHPQDDRVIFMQAMGRGPEHESYPLLQSGLRQGALFAVCAGMKTGRLRRACG